MNTDQVRGMAMKVEGKVREQVGKLVGSKEQQINGISKQIYGRTLKRVGDVKLASKHINNT